MTEQVKGKYETVVTEKMGKFDEKFTKDGFVGGKIPFNNAVVGAGVLLTLWGTGMDAAEANSLMASGFGSAMAFAGLKAGEHTIAYHVAVAGAQKVDKTVDVLKKSDLANKFKAGYTNLNKKVRVIMNKAKTQAQMARHEIAFSRMPVYQGVGDGTVKQVGVVKSKPMVVANRILKNMFGKGK